LVASDTIIARGTLDYFKDKCRAIT
jgi:hypothetical protein